MTQTTLTVKEATRERFNDLKDELAEVQPECPDHTADSFLNALMDEWEADPHEVDLDRFELYDDEVLVFAKDVETAHELAGELSGASEEAIVEHLEDALDTVSMVGDPGVVVDDSVAQELYDEIRKAQELAEQARDAAQAVEAEVGQR